MTDSNGNKITRSAGVFTDGLTTSPAVPVLSITGNAAQSLAWTDVLGNAQSTYETDTTYTVETAYGCHPPNEDMTLASQSVLTKITFADTATEGLDWEATPNKGAGFTTGRLARITLPTGGTVSLGYGSFQCAYLEPTSALLRWAREFGSSVIGGVGSMPTFLVRHTGLGPARISRIALWINNRNAKSHIIYALSRITQQPR